MATPASSRPRALVTGASAGIGVQYAHQLAQKGYDLVLVARRKQRLDALAAELSEKGKVNAEVLVADLTTARDLSHVEARLAEDPAMTLLVNNAGFGGYRPFVQLDPKIADTLIGIHVTAVTRLSRAVLPGMVARGKGGIINVASLLALSGTLPANPLPARAVYAGGKAFMVAFTQCLAGELAGTGVKVQVCLPGIVATEFHAVQNFDRGSLPAMSAQDVVTASLAALELGEVVCIPGLEDPAVFDKVGEMQRTTMTAARATLAARYKS